MVRSLLLDIISKGRMSDIILLFLIIISFSFSWFTVLYLGLRILKVKIKLKHIILGALLGSFIAIFLKPFVSNPFSFLVTVIPLLISLKILSKAKWTITAWVTFILLLVNTIGPWLFINPLSSVNRNIGLFFFQNKLGLPIIGLIETFGAILLLIVLNISNISLIPQTNQSFIDFVTVYIFIALFYWCHHLTVDIWKNPMRFMFKPFFDWTVAVAAMIGFYLLLMNYKKREQAKDQEIQRLKESKIDTQELKSFCNLVTDNLNNCNEADIGFGDLLDIYFNRREQDVLCLMAQGKDNIEIAETLDLAIGTVKNHVIKIKAKTQLQDRHKMILYAICWVKKHKDKPVKQKR